MQSEAEKMEVRTNSPLIRQQNFIMKSSDVDEKGTQDATEEERCLFKFCGCLNAAVCDFKLVYVHQIRIFDLEACRLMSELDSDDHSRAQTPT